MELTPTEQLHYDAINSFIEVDNLTDPIHGPYSALARDSITFTAKKCAKITEQEKLKFGLFLIADMRAHPDKYNNVNHMFLEFEKQLQQQLNELTR